MFLLCEAAFAFARKQQHHHCTKTYPHSTPRVTRRMGGVDCGKVDPQSFKDLHTMKPTPTLASPSTPTTAQTPDHPHPQPFSTSNPHFYSAYSPKIKSQLTFPPAGRTKQGFKDECDINTIMRRYAQTGALTHLNERTPIFGDMAEIDFQGSLEIVITARNRFAELPSAVRDRFGNDPAQLLAFVQDVGNRDEAIKLGLIRPAESTTTTAPPAPTKEQSSS